MDGEAGGRYLAISGADRKVSLLVHWYVCTTLMHNTTLIACRDVSHMSYMAARAFLGERGVLNGTTPSDKLDPKVKAQAMKFSQALKESGVCE
jgi:hypothetical protein